MFLLNQLNMFIESLSLFFSFPLHCDIIVLIDTFFFLLISLSAP
uniref:Uncharacterized protein n=1 Tax=Rhizophora mucronata TaxID=61149 RepID=A0A2P2P9Q2_RHIMU